MTDKDKGLAHVVQKIKSVCGKCNGQGKVKLNPCDCCNGKGYHTYEELAEGVECS